MTVLSRAAVKSFPAVDHNRDGAVIINFYVHVGLEPAGFQL